MQPPAGSWSAWAGSISSCCAQCSRCPEWHYSCVWHRGASRGRVLVRPDNKTPLNALSATGMNPQKFSAIAHRDHDYCNPISAAKIERVLDLLPLDDTSRVL